MRIGLGLVLLSIVGCHVAFGQESKPRGTPNIPVVSFCDLMGHPDQYNGKKVRVSATYASASEKAIFFDDACKKSQPGRELVAKAQFTGTSDNIKRSIDKLNKVFDKAIGPPYVAKATMIAIFKDEYAVRDKPICLDCPQYTLEVEQLLSAERIGASTPTRRE